MKFEYKNVSFEIIDYAHTVNKYRGGLSIKLDEMDDDLYNLSLKSKVTRPFGAGNLTIKNARLIEILPISTSNTSIGIYRFVNIAIYGKYGKMTYEEYLVNILPFIKQMILFSGCSHIRKIPVNDKNKLWYSIFQLKPSYVPLFFNLNNGVIEFAKSNYKIT